MESPKNTSPQKKKEEITRKPHKHSTTTSKKKSKDIIGRRFSDEQIKSLESIFSVETKLEPKKKMQLATDLGLQPRQVAIWFQNKRARWKSKQMEQEYRDLRANYDCLYMQFDDLKKEKESLQMQVQELSELVKNVDNVNLTDRDDESKEYPNEEMDDGDIMKTDDHDHERVISKDFEKTQEQELVSWSEEEEIISHLASPEKWCNFSSDGLFDQSSGTSNWWEN